MSARNDRSVFPLATEVARTWHELDSIGFVKYRHTLADTAADTQAPRLERMSSGYRLLIADGFDLVSYVREHVRSGSPSASYMNDHDGDVL